MLKFINHFTVKNNGKMEVSIDSSVRLDQIFSVKKYVGEEYLSLEYREDNYIVDLARLVDNEKLDVTQTIADVVAWMNEQVLFTYHEPSFNSLQKQFVVLSHGDYINELKVSACNKSMDTDSPLLNDPGYKDVSIRLNGRDLTNVIPILDSVIYRPVWSNGNIYIEGAASQLMSNPETSFLVLTNSGDITISDIDGVDSVVEIPEGKFPVLVADGKLNFEEDSLSYHTDGSSRYARLDGRVKKQLEAMVSPIYHPYKNTFIIFIEGNRVLERKIYTSEITDGIVEFADPNRLVLVRDRSGYVHPAVTSCFDVKGVQRQYCYTEVDKPHLAQVYVV